MPRGSLGHAAYWSIVGYVEYADEDGGYVTDDYDVALVLLSCRSDALSRQRMVSTLVGPVCGTEAVESIACVACGEPVRVPTPPWAVSSSN